MVGLGPKELNVRTVLHTTLHRTVDWCKAVRVTINMLPDLVLLKIFEFYKGRKIDAWHTLVHVCRQWQIIVFGSPRRLDLRLRCRASTPVRTKLDVWPPLPIFVGATWDEPEKSGWGMDNIVAALERNDRISGVAVSNILSSDFEELLAAMQKPFPALKLLEMSTGSITVPTIPASFLGGSAPCLQSLYLNGFPFPRLPNFLFSAPHLVHLSLLRIPDSGYFSPEALAAGLSTLTRLECFIMTSESPQFCSGLNSRHLPLQTRSLLPVLTELQFRGVDKYLEDLVARIDAPLLNELEIAFIHQQMPATSQLTQFIYRTPKLKAQGEARVTFSRWDVSVKFPQKFDGNIHLGILCTLTDEQLSALPLVCGSSAGRALVPTVERLYVLPHRDSPLLWRDNIENGRRLNLLCPFFAVKSLYISREFMPWIAPALQELVGERATEVLPALQNLYLETLASIPVQEAIGQFVAARQLSGHPIAVFYWEYERD